MICAEIEVIGSMVFILSPIWKWGLNGMDSEGRGHLGWLKLGNGYKWVICETLMACE
jgi:hypothetical protein